MYILLPDGQTVYMIDIIFIFMNPHDIFIINILIFSGKISLNWLSYILYYATFL